MTQIILDNQKKEVRIDATCHADGSATLKFTGPTGEATLAFAQPVDLLNLAGDMLRMARFGYSGQGEIGIPRAIDALFTAPPLKGTPSEDTIVFVPIAGKAKRHCCQPDCGAAAEYEIHTLRVTNEGKEALGGPDIYADQTDACTTHVGCMLGYQPDANNPNEIFWKVIPIRK